MSALDLPNPWFQRTEKADRMARPVAASADTYAGLAEHETMVETAWYGFQAVYKLSNLNLRGFAWCDAREAYGEAQALWQTAVSALAKSNARLEAMDLAQAAICSLTSELAGLHERAALNPYARLRCRASFVPAQGAVMLRPWILSPEGRRG